jgi:hypothetical protein
MPGPSEYSPFDRTPWLLAIGEWLRSEYDSSSEPLPERLTALITQVQELFGTGVDAWQRTPVTTTRSSPPDRRTNRPAATRAQTAAVNRRRKGSARQQPAKGKPWY